MGGIFVSYRRVDSEASAGRLFDHLVRRLGKDQVFMDTGGGIPAGASFPAVLVEALASCDALVAVIGRSWLTCTRTDGRPRLAIPDDWVRTEIRTALQRGVPLCPVLVDHAQLPAASDLPDDIRDLATRQKAELTATRWAYDVEQLVSALARQAHLHLVDDVGQASTGLGLLRDLITRVPAVAEDVGRSREVIANTHRQIGRLEVHKTVHDALHQIEFMCLRPLEAADAFSPLFGMRRAFADHAAQIQAALQREGVGRQVVADLGEALENVATGFATAEAFPEDAAARVRLLDDLRTLLRNGLEQVERGIFAAAGELDLARLVELMDRVERTVKEKGGAGGPELDPLLAGIAGLRRLQDDLAARVEDHAALQDFDYKLRTLVEQTRPQRGEATLPASLRSGWARLQQRSPVRASARTAELAAAVTDIEAAAAYVTAALGRGDHEAQRVWKLLDAYLDVVSSAFRGVDTRLKELCLRLATVAAQPLALVLEQCRTPDHRVAGSPPTGEEASWRAQR